MKIHLLNSRAERFTECAKDLEGSTIAATRTPGDVTCRTCVDIMAADGTISHADRLQWKIRRLQSKLLVA